MTGQHTYSTPYGGREIYRDGKPFAVIGKPNDAPQCVEYHNDLSAFGRLAAAAPDLLAALELILSPSPHYAATKAHRDLISEARAKGLAAIAKAKASEATP